jgi:hypothetical protein
MSTPSFPSVMRAAALSVPASVVGNVVIYFAGGSMGADWKTPPGAAFEVVPVGAVVAASMVPNLIAGLVYAGMARLLGARAPVVFAGLSVVLCVASMGGPAGAPQAMTGVLLGLMHVVSALAITVPLVRVR